MYSSEAEAMAGAMRLPGSGWQCLACDDPRRGVFGVDCFKLENLGPPLGNEETSCTFEWVMFGAELTPEVEDCDKAALIEWVRAEPEVHKFTDAKDMMGGLVSYRRAAEGIALIRRVPYRDFRTVCIELGLDELDESGRHDRSRAVAAALQGALAARSV